MLTEGVVALAEEIERRVSRLEKRRDEQAIQILALQLVLEHAVKIAYGAGQFTPQHIKQMHDAIRSGFREVTLNDRHPVQSDHFSAELAEAVEEILARLEPSEGS